MPNWCTNTATFEHDDEEILQSLVDAFNCGQTMNTFWPCPQELKDTTAGYVGDEEKQKELEKKQAENVKKYGSPHWYDWCCDNWGVKWDFGRDQSSGEPEAKIEENDGKKYVKLSFSTAWAPPISFYDFMCRNLGFRIRAYYFEPGMGFVGTSHDGQEHTINIRELTQEWLEDHVPAKLCEEFNLYEYAAQAEEFEREHND
jgi:hypothetical protein